MKSALPIFWGIHARQEEKPVKLLKVDSTLYKNYRDKALSENKKLNFY